VLGALPFWWLYGRAEEEGVDAATGQGVAVERGADRRGVKDLEEGGGRENEKGGGRRMAWLMRGKQGRGLGQRQRSENFWHGGIGMVHEYPGRESSSHASDGGRTVTGDGIKDGNDTGDASEARAYGARYDRQSAA